VIESSQRGRRDRVIKWEGEREFSKGKER